ncbi:hypothetical protein SAMN04487850_1425 [Prevotella aff. ruminicola Tc2-24]|uniref:Uncharacterized protein n=1 Tax=Prevotella aff. ruminicola Tc2-24 TaxID=81582 RepID=A0A1I0NXL9_9BACT|nr:hypothetical protein SAMN04487850_1425 [Prevotella aff. ruminicola Tc2-24]
MGFRNPLQLQRYYCKVHIPCTLRKLTYIVGLALLGQAKRAELERDRLRDRFLRRLGTVSGGGDLMVKEIGFMGERNGTLQRKR